MDEGLRGYMVGAFEVWVGKLLRAGLDTGCRPLLASRFPATFGTLRFRASPTTTCPCMSFHTAAALTICLILAACSTPTPPPLPTPAPTPRPGAEAFSLDLSQPSIGLGLSINGDVPPVVVLPDGYTFGTFPGPAVDGQNCADPSPCYTVENGALKIRSPGGGWPIITRQTFAGAQSHRLVASADCLSAGCWGGLVVYDGDAIAGTNDLSTGAWMGIYFSHADDGYVQIGVWSPTVVHTAFKVRAGTTMEFRIDYSEGRWTFLANGQPLPVDQTPDMPVLQHDPHAALFMGDLNMTVTAWDVWVGP